MLILTRRLDEEFVIGETIRVKVLKSSGNRVTLGVQAPDALSICRHEHVENANLDCGPLLARELEMTRR